jgi:predicted dehydrogenase
VTSVLGASSRTRGSRLVGSGPRAGERIPVSTDTHVTGVLQHESGALSTLVMTFDAVATQAAHLELHGETGSLVVPDPNRFAGDVRLQTLDQPSWSVLEVSAGYRDAGRGYGVADLARTPAGGEPRAGGTLALHVLDIMQSLLASAGSGRSETPTTTAARPAAVPLQSLPAK